MRIDSSWVEYNKEQYPGNFKGWIVNNLEQFFLLDPEMRRFQDQLIYKIKN